MLLAFVIGTTAKFGQTLFAWKPCIVTFLLILLHTCTLVRGNIRHLLLDNNTCQFASYDISIKTSYSVSWDGRHLPRLCRLGFRVSNINYYQICASSIKYSVKDCTFSMQYYHGISTKANKNYTCSTPPAEYCVKSTRYFYLHFNARQTSDSVVTIDITARAKEQSSQRHSSVMEILVGGLASLLFVGFSCFVFGARSRNPRLCLVKTFRRWEVCDPCMARMESSGCITPSPDVQASSRVPREGRSANSGCCVLLDCVIPGDAERRQQQSADTTHALDAQNNIDESGFDQPPPYNSLTITDGRSDRSEIQPTPIWIQLSPPPYEAPPPAYEDIIGNK